MRQSLDTGVSTVMFDFYGTVVDMQSGLIEAMTPYLADKGYTANSASRVVTWWRRTHFESSMIDALLHREHTPYREIGRQAVGYTLARAGIVHTMDEVDALVSQIERLRPFGDAVAGLQTLKDHGFQLVVLSNGDPEMLERGVACLVEKPIAATSVEAFDLVEAARRGGAVLQVGHVERFNPVMTAVERLRMHPVFLEVHRLAPFTFRSSDVGVVMDLMIHDLDIVLHLVGEEPSEISAVGVPVLGGREDIANARLTFPSGCVANVTASRVSLTKMRKIRVFSQDAYVSLDYDRRQALLVKKSPKLTEAELKRAAGGGGDLAALAGVDFGDLLSTEMLPIDEAEPLKEEIRTFLGCVRTGDRPRVSGEEGARALRLAERILADMQSRPLPARE